MIEQGYEGEVSVIVIEDENGEDRMQQQIQANYKQVKTDIIQLITDELTRIENDPELAHLIRKEEGEE